jgi:hypothetical protein
MKMAPNTITLNLDSDALVSIKGAIAPIEYTQYDFHVKWDELVNLRVAEPEKEYPTSIFCDFLPKEAVSVGTPWEIERAGVLKLLKQLHPEPHLDMHGDSGDSCGLWACLHAYNDEFADIIFRIHAEFKLENGWFTPSQFAGHLVIDRVKESVAFFEMRVPEGSVPVNFDVNQIRFGTKITGMGFCSQMELRAGTPDFLRNVEFAASITQEAADRALISRFYKSQQINWVPPDQVLEMAQVQQKPIHAISIDGPLMDESC